jgi:hypothetical protein
LSITSTRSLKGKPVSNFTLGSGYVGIGVDPFDAFVERLKEALSKPRATRFAFLVNNAGKDASEHAV